MPINCLINPYVYAPLPPPPGAAYWRVRSDVILGATSLAAAKIEFRQTVGGGDLSTGGTAIASTVSGANVAANAFDANAATRWESAIGGADNTHWIGYHFSSPFLIVEYRYQSRDTSSPGQQPRHGFCEYSSDGSAWTIAWVNWGMTWGGFQPEVVKSNPTIAGTAGGKYLWRINVSVGNSGGDIKIAEITMLESAVNKATGGGARASSSIGGSEVNAFAGDGSASHWRCGTGTTPQWIGYQMPARAAITSVTLQAGSDAGFAAEAPQAFTIESSIDHGVTWQVEWSVTGQTGWTASQIRTFNKP